MPDLLLGMVGLARRAGKLVFGFDAVMRAAADGSASLVLLASNASERTTRAAVDGCTGTGTECIRVNQTMEEIGLAIGRNSTAVLAICDQSMANRIKELFHA